MSSMTIGILCIVAFLALIFLGMNIGLALLATGFVGYALVVNPTAALAVLRTDPATQASTYSFMVVPLFILMGNFAFQAGLSTGLYDTANKWLSRLPGSLACATVAACAGFGAICGSCAATCATMGTIALPEMRRFGYDDRLSTGAVAMGGTLGVLIPPSTPMIVYCIMAEVSIGTVFLAGVLPGIMMTVLCILTIVTLCLKNRGWAGTSTQYSWQERLLSLKHLVPVVLLFGVVLGGMFSGYFSVNQSSAVGAFMAMLMMAWHIFRTSDHKLSEFWKRYKVAMWTSIETFAMTLLIMIGASVFCKMLAITGIPSALASWIGGLNVSKYVIIALMTLVYLFLGMIMDEMPMIMLTVPIFLPIIKELGFSPIWFGIYVIMVMELGAITPPVGLNCFIINGIAKDVSLGTIYRGVLPFVLTVFLAIVLITAFPGIVLFLPGLSG